MSIPEKERPYQKGDRVTIEKGTSHGFQVGTQTLLLSIQSPPIIDPETGKVDIEYVAKRQL